MKNSILFSLLLLLCCVHLSAQNKPQRGLGNIGRVYGKLLEERSKEPIEFASVTVFRTVGKKDSLIGGCLTKSNGDFSIDELPLGLLSVKISFVGFQDFTKKITLAPPDNLEIDLGDLLLKTDAKVLAEVKVSAEKVQMQLGLDKKVFNVEKNITATGGTAEDVLRNIPSVTIDVDGNAKLRDNATTIYVDGRPTLMTTNQIPADQIESIEVISNPSAKFEAATAGGILNIILKKNRKPGYNGFLAFGVGTGKRYNGTFNLNIRQGHWNVTTFYNFNDSRNPTNSYSFRETLDGERFFDQKTNTTFGNLFQIGRVAVDYSINNRNTLTVAGNIVNGNFNINADQAYSYPQETRDSSLHDGVRMIRPRNAFTRYQAQTTWKRTYGTKGRELTADANFEWGSSSNTSKWTTTGFGAAGAALPNFPELVDISGGNIGQQLTVQLDYVSPLSDSSKLEMGLRSFANGRNQQYFFKQLNYATNQYELQSGLSQNADVTDFVNAAYVTYTNRFRGIAYQVGLRYEQSNLRGISRLDNVASFGYDFPKVSNLLTGFFPSFYLSKKLSQSSEIQVNFSRKIQRPDMMQLMPIIQNNDRQNIRIGNPALQPEFINLAEMNFNKIFGSNNWLASAYFMLETNTIKPFARASATDPTVLITTFLNAKNETRYGLDNTMKFALTKQIDLMTNLNVYNLSISTDSTLTQAWAYDVKAILNVKLPKSVSVQMSGNYQSNRVLPQGIRKGVPSMDLAVKKSFFGGAANITFTVSDVFNSRREILAYDFPQFYQENMRRRDLRFFRLSFQVPFGKADASIFKKAKEGSRRQQGQGEMDFGS